MALATNFLRDGYSTSDTTEYTTGDLTPTGDALVMVAVLGHDTGNAAEVPTLSGTNWANGLEWSQEATQPHADGDLRITLFSATAPESVTTGTITFTYSSTHEGNAYLVFEWTDDSTPSVLQAVNDSGNDTTASIALTSPTSATGGVVGWLGNNAPSAGTGFTEYSGAPDPLDHPAKIHGVYDDALEATTPVLMNTHAGALDWLGIAFEVGTSGGASPEGQVVTTTHHDIK